MAFTLNHVHLKTPDPEKTAQFYVDNLGAKIVGQAGGNGLRLDLHGLTLNVTKFIETQKHEQKYSEYNIVEWDSVGVQSISHKSHFTSNYPVEVEWYKDNRYSYGFPGNARGYLVHSIHLLLLRRTCHSLV